MKRTITSIAAAAVVLGTAAPMAFAATTSGLTQANTLPITVNGTVLSNPYEMTGQDSGNTTGFFPVYYFEQALNKIGFTATWDGTTHTFAINAPGVTPAAVAGGVGTGNTTVTVNGTAVKMFNTQTAKDPAGGAKAQITTYMPIYYINNVLTALGVNGSFSGQTGLSIESANAVAAKLSTPTVTGATVGTGTQTSPAISEAGGAVTVATTLTDGNGNPIANANLSLTFTGSAVQPTVEQGSSYATIGGTAANGWTATVTTNASGTATFTVNGLNSYELAIDTPYSTNGTTVSQTVYLGFVNNQAIMTPSTGYSATTSTGSNATTGLVPVTLTLPESNSKPQSGQEVTFVLSNNTNGDLTKTGTTYTNANTTSAYFATSTGTNISSNYVTAYTDSNGQATVWVNDYNPENVYVTAFSGAYPLASNTSTASTELEYAAANAPTSTLSSIGVGAFAPNANYTPSATSATGLAASANAYFVPLDANGNELTGTNAEATYNLSASNGGEIASINGDALSNYSLGTPSSAQVQLTDATESAGVWTYDWSVDGVAVASTNVPYFYVGLTNEGSGGSTLTVTNGSLKATAAYGSGDSASYVSSFSPSTVDINNFGGDSSNVTFTVVDASGNPVANSAAQVQFDGSSNNVWVTAVNGTALTQSVGTSGASEPTPIPLFDAHALGTGVPTDNANGFAIPGVVSWLGNDNAFTVFTNSNGQVTLTIQSGDVQYATGSVGSAVSVNSGTPASTNSYTYAYTYGSGNAGNQATLYFGQPGAGNNPTNNSGWGTNGYQVGTIAW